VFLAKQLHFFTGHVQSIVNEFEVWSAVIRL